MDPSIFIAGHALTSSRRRPVYAESPPWERSTKRPIGGPIAAAVALVSVAFIVLTVV